LLFFQEALINIESNNAFIAGINTVQYDTTKAAITGLTRGMARSYSEAGIRVNAVCPGPTFTPFHMKRRKLLELMKKNSRSNLQDL
jgi:NAD(P)-dependent dehydrogenase (short-subunit alcohol dehydrogenase family)